MAIRPILRMGHPILRRRAEPVGDPATPEIRALVADMVDTMRAAHGRGIAAPQIGVSRRLVIFHAPLDDQNSRAVADAPLTVLADPVVEVLDPALASDWEGCLSVPGLKGLVPRARVIRYRGLDLDGRPVERIARDFHARVAQHEIDHLDGILYPQRMTDLGTLEFLDSEPFED
ncbi:peptide deformylase [Zavarzinia compransoris]|nr:peptide deformylase [Zavarzinia compransoris]TDP46957.1 peptide deformylase [Zavarzinia compransoris]